MSTDSFSEGKKSIDKDIKQPWDYEVARIQHDINNPSSMLQGKIITKIDFWVKNRKHVWRKTIEKMPNPLEPSKTVGESMSISKYKNHVVLYPKGQQRIVKDGTVRELRPEDCHGDDYVMVRINKKTGERA